MHPFQVSHGRFLFAFMVIGSVAAAKGMQVRAPNLKLHLGRTLFGFTGVTAMFAAAAFIPLGDATAISFLNPVFAMMLAIPFLGERVGPVRCFAAVVAMVGALVLLRPTPDSFQPAALLALLAAAALGMEVIFIKKLSGREPALQILLVNNAIGLILASIAVLAVWQMPTAQQWGALIALGGTMALAQFCFVSALARAEASFIAPFSYATLIFAALYDWAIYHQIPDTVSYLGAAIILTGAAVLARREALAKKRLTGDASDTADA